MPKYLEAWFLNIGIESNKYNNISQIMRFESMVKYHIWTIQTSSIFSDTKFEHQSILKQPPYLG